MIYVLLFLEGIITFISPCLLPLLPVYVSYFAGGNNGGKPRPLFNAVGFVLGFTIVFVAMGAFAGTIGGLLLNYTRVVNIITGFIVVVLGLNYLGAVNLRIFQTPRKFQFGNSKPSSFSSAFVFGVVLSIAWTPCVSIFLGAALSRAVAQGTAREGMFMLLIYSLGLGLPFIASAVLIDRLKGAFSFIKKNYRTINILSGAFLVLVGIFMMTGIFDRLARWFS